MDIQYPVVTNICRESALLFSLEDLLLVVSSHMIFQPFDAILGSLFIKIQAERPLTVDCKLTQSEHLVLVDSNIRLFRRIQPIFPFLSNIWSSVDSLARAMITLNILDFMHSAFHTAAWTFWVDFDV
jgi:hypothetical protein